MCAKTNFKTKKALKDAVKNGERIAVFQPGPFGNNIENGIVCLEGPDYPEPHKWYAKAKLQNGVIVEVR